MNVPPSESRSKSPPSPQDDFLDSSVRTLVVGARLPEEKALLFLDWWRREQAPGETFLSFLVRQRLLTASELGAIESAANGFFPPSAAFRLRIKAVGLQPFQEPTNDEGDQHSAEALYVPSNESTEIRPGVVLGRIRIDEKLSEGGFGVVFRGLHGRLDIPVAVKVLRSVNRDRDSAEMRGFLDEARLMAQLNHPNVVRIWDLEDAHRPPYLVLEYVDGPSAQQLIQHQGAVLPSKAVNIARQVLRGLRAAYQLGIVHRDVKPANILLHSDGVAKLADFGLARLTGDRRRPGSKPYLDNSEDVFATAEYMAPEHARGIHTDPRSDMYSVGATLFELLSGKPPFSGKTPFQIVYHAATKPVPNIAELVPNLDPRLAQVVTRLLSKLPEDRYASYEELLSALDGF